MILILIKRNFGVDAFGINESELVVDVEILGNNGVAIFEIDCGETAVWSLSNGQSPTSFDLQNATFDLSQVPSGSYTVSYNLNIPNCTQIYVGTFDIEVTEMPSTPPPPPYGLCAGDSIDLSTLFTFSNPQPSHLIFYSSGTPGNLNPANIINPPIVSPSMTTTYPVEIYYSGCPDPTYSNIRIEIILGADAGFINGLSNPYCPSVTISVNAPGTQFGPGFNEIWIISDGDNIVSTHPSGNITLPNNCTGNFTLYHYSYHDNLEFDENASTISSIDCPTGCCDVESENLSLGDTEGPVIDDAGISNIVLNCGDPIPPPASLGATDDCATNFPQNITASVNDPGADCSTDRVITYTWETMDECGNPSNVVTQTVTVPADTEGPVIDGSGISNVSLDCGDAIPPPVTLSATDNCDGSFPQNVTATVDDTGVSCTVDRVITYTWSIDDACNNPSNEIVQTLTIAADSELPSFTSPLADVTVCEDNIPAIGSLTWTDNCDGTGSVVGTSMSDGNTNPEILSYTWTYKDACNNEASEIQLVTVYENPNAGSDNSDQLCNISGTDLDLNTLLSSDAQGGGVWSETSSSGQFDPTTGMFDASNLSEGDYTFNYTVSVQGDVCPPDVVNITISIISSANAGMDGSDVVCNGGSANTSIDIEAQLGGAQDAGGQWTDISGIGVNLSDINNVSFVGIAPGDYDFMYEIAANGLCPGDDATITITVNEVPVINIAEVMCDGLVEYQIIFNTTANSVNHSGGGLLMNNGGGDYEISGIDIANSVTITFSNSATGCEDEITVNPPNCSCPTINPPIDNSPVNEICFGDNNPTLMVSVDATNTANWYDVASGGSVLTGGAMTTSFTPTETAVGVYTYYVEAQDIAIPSCVSATRTPVTFTILDLPSASDATLEVCDDDTDGFAFFNLTVAEGDVNGGSGLSYDFFESQLDAENNTNSIGSNYTNTTAGTQIIYVSVTEVNDCKSIAEITLIVNENPELNAAIDHESCFGENDGMITLTGSAGSGNYLFSEDNISFDPTNIFGPLGPGNHTFYLMDDSGCVDEETFTIEPGTDISIDALTINCNDMGTGLDPDDDFYEVCFTILVSNPGASNSYNVLNSSSVNLGTFNYGVNECIQIDAEGFDETLTIEDSDQSTCSELIPLGVLNPCSSDCNISINNLTFTCDDAGTESDATDDFYTITFDATAINGSASGLFSVEVGGQIQGTFSYGSNVSFTLEASGANTILSLIDFDDVNCFYSEPLDLSPCSDACFLTVVQNDIICNDNGTPGDATDDFYQVTFSITGINAGASNTVNVLLDNVFVQSSTYGSIGTIDIPADGNVHSIRFEDSEDASCFVEETTVALVTCSNSCSLEIINLTFTCNDGGTGSDPSDDNYDLSFEVNPTNGGGSNLVTVFVDGNNAGVFAYNTLIEITVSALGPDIILLVSDFDDAVCNTNETIQLIPCSNDCLLSLDQFQEDCIDNGTGEDATDDFYNISFLVSALNGSASGNVTVFVDGIPDPGNPYSYDNAAVIQIPADGMTHVIRFEDSDDANCFVEVNTSELIPCSTDCSNQINNLIYTCNDNGTPDISSDDFYDISFYVSSVNGSVSNLVTVFLGGIVINTFNYDELITFQTGAVGNNIILSVADVDDPACFNSETLDLSPCSDACSLTLTYFEQLCSDAGTGDDATDDFYIINFQAEAVNGSTSNTFNVLVGGVLQGSYTYGIASSFMIPADGTTPMILFQDVDDPLCSDEFSLTVLDPCSNSCSLSIAGLILDCNDGGTGTDPADDLYDISFTISATNGSASNEFEVFLGGASMGVFTYDNLVSFQANAGSASIDLSIVDVDDPNCTIIENINLSPCSNDCELSITSLMFECNDNSTPDNPTDDFYTITYEVNGNNQGASNSFDILLAGVDIGDGIYGTIGTVQVDADGASPTISFVDTDDNTCLVTQVIGPLIPCSTSCGISVDQFEISCNDNGTPANGADDFYEIIITVNASNPSPTDGYEVFLGGVSSGTQQYGDTWTLSSIPADGSNSSVSFVDIDDPLCEALEFIGPLVPCSDECAMVNDVFSYNCNDGGTLDNPNDDIYELMLNITASGAGVAGSFELFFDNVSQGIFNYGELHTIDLPADGSNVDVLIQDLTDPNCNYTENIGPLTSCSNNCVVSIASYSETCNDNGTPGDATDDFYEITFDVIVNNNPATDFDIFDNLGVLITSFNIATGANFTFPANGQINDLNIQSVGGAECSIVEFTGVLEQCSNEICDQVVDAGPAQLLNCNNRSVELVGTSSEIGLYNWTGPGLSSGDSVVQVSNFGMYYFEVTYSATCSKLDSVFVDEDFIAPFVEIAEPDSISCVVTNVIIDATTSTINATVDVQWLNGSQDIIAGETGLTLDVDMAGWYYLLSTDISNGCTTLDSVEVFQTQDVPIAEAGVNVLLDCDQNTTQLSGTGSSTGASYIYLWTSSEANQMITNPNALSTQVVGAGTYYLEVTDSSNGCNAIDSVQVIENSGSILFDNLIVENESCFAAVDGLVDLSTLQGDNPPFSFSINGGSLTSNPVFTNLEPGLHTILVEDNSGCENNTIITIDAAEDIGASIIGDPTIYLGTGNELQLITNLDPNEIADIAWTPSEGLTCVDCYNPIANPTVPTEYFVLVTDVNGCMDEASITMNIFREINVYIPNTFSPNNDGINDYFTVYSDETVLHVLEFRVFNRWGAEVYERTEFLPNDPNMGWNGSFNGQNLTPDVFVYYAKVETYDGQIEEYRGDVTIIK